MKKIKFFLSFFLLMFFVCAYAEEGSVNDVNFNSGTVIDAENASYKNSLIMGAPIAVVHAETFDYINDGVLSSFMADPHILWVDYSPKPGDPSSQTNSVKVSVTVAGSSESFKIRQIGYRIQSNSSVFDDSLPYTILYNNDTGVYEQTVSTSTTVTFAAGEKHYIQWYAQHIGGGGATQIYEVSIASDSINIIQPNLESSSRPTIEAIVFSSQGDLQANKLKIIINDESGNVVYDKTADEIGDSIFDTSTGVLKYKYDGEPLANGKKYTIKLEYDEIKTSSEFTVNSEPISLLLPYPSPYNPKNGTDMKIKFIIAEESAITINIYDRAGKFVSKVIDSKISPSGENIVNWKAKSYYGEELANGVYICEIIMKSGGKENRRYKSFAILRK